MERGGYGYKGERRLETKRREKRDKVRGCIKLLRIGGGKADSCVARMSITISVKMSDLKSANVEGCDERYDERYAEGRRRVMTRAKMRCTKSNIISALWSITMSVNDERYGVMMNVLHCF